jgi:phage terminase large subunit-like protein
MRARSLHATSLGSRAELPRNELIATLTPAEARALLYEWAFWARPNQLPPNGQWRIWLVLAGRGFGKTRTGAEMIRARVTARTAHRLALVAPTAGDARDVMVEGESGILAISPPWERPRYEPSKRRLTWPNGAIATLFSADEPERLRGPQHDAAWCDELASWRHPEAWDMLMFGLRLGTDPRVVVTTTPRTTSLIRGLIADPAVIATRGTTYENRANLASAFFGQIIRKYQGTRLGRQELEAELLEDVPGALWNRGMLEGSRVRAAPPLIRVVVAIDPAASSTERADETGIIVAGKDAGGRGWVLADASGRYQPTEWAKTAVSVYRAHKADRIVAEVNNGGDIGRGDAAGDRAKRALLGRACFPRKGNSRRTDCGALRARPGAPPRGVPATRGSNVRLYRRCARQRHDPFSRPLSGSGRCAGLGTDRSPG